MQIHNNFQNRTYYDFSDDKSNCDLIIGNAFSTNINFDGFAYSILADDGHLITTPGAIGETRLNTSDLQFHLVCSKNHFINLMSVHQISVILKEIADETQYSFDDPVQFYVEAHEQNGSVLRIASTLCVYHKNNELLLETVNASATPLLATQTRKNHGKSIYSK